MSVKTKAVISIVLNTLMTLITIGIVISYFFTKNFLIKTNQDIFTYFTTDSNLLACIAAIVMVVFDIQILRGKRTVIPVDAKELSQIALSMLKSLGELDARKDKLIDIAIDNKIDSSELPEFVAIKDALADIAMTAGTMQLWIDKMIATGEITEEEMDAARKR